MDGADLIGTMVDDWKITAKIGEGAMGAVFRARKGRQRAAIKVALPHTLSKKALERFRREAHMLMEIQHPNVVRCFSAGENEDFVYLALEYLEGGTLQDLLHRRGKLTVPQAVRLMRQILAGLSAIHERGIIHRDVKPDNILLDMTGVAKLGDFSMARAERHAKITTAGTILGTLDYMAPEQVEDDKVDQRVDLYAAGAMLYHLVVGKPPYSGRSGLAILQQHQRAPVPDVTEDAPEAAVLAPVVRSLMAKKPDLRPGSAQEALGLLAGMPEAPLMEGAGSGTLTPATDSASMARRPSRLLDLVCVGVLFLAALHGADWVLRGEGTDLLEIAGEFPQDEYVGLLRDSLDKYWIPWLCGVALLLLDRVLARLTGAGFLGRVGRLVGLG